MKKLVMVAIAMILFISFAPSFSAKSSDMFIDYLTNMIWNDCKGEEIHINQPIIHYITTNQTLTTIKDKNELRQVITIFGEMQHQFEDFRGTCDQKEGGWSGINGCGILTCGSNRLDINGYNYFWNGVKVDVPQENFNLKATYGANSSIIETHGENSPVTTGSNSPINQQEDSIWIQLFWPKVTILGIVVGIVVTKLTELAIEQLKKRNKWFKSG